LNSFAPLLLAAMAIFSCFEDRHAEYVLARPIVRTVFSAIVLFATLVAALPVLLRVPLRPTLAVSAALCTILSALAVLPREKLRMRSTWIAMLGGAVLAAILIVIAAPMLPPAPVQRLASATTSKIVDKEPHEPTAEFAVGVERVYAWFAIAAPDKYAQRIRFRWIHDGVPIAKEWETDIVGGRKTGFRTWGAITHPVPGEWKVELLADSGQLLGRQHFSVMEATERNTAAVPTSTAAR
jgi:hypothetical protein